MTRMRNVAVSYPRGTRLHDSVASLNEFHAIRIPLRLFSQWTRSTMPHLDILGGKVVNSHRVRIIKCAVKFGREAQARKAFRCFHVN